MWNNFPVGPLFPLLSLVLNDYVFQRLCRFYSVSVQGAEAGAGWETEPGFPAQRELLQSWGRRIGSFVPSSMSAYNAWWNEL